MARNTAQNINEISYLKGIWEKGTGAEKKWAEDQATQYYNQLRSSGNTAVADKLSGMNYNDAYNYYKSTYSPQENSFDSSGYITSYKKSADKLSDLQAQKATDYYKSQMGDINSQYDNSLKQNYYSYMNANKQLPQVLSASGITGGMAESNALRLANEYQSNNYNTEKERNATINDINAKIRAANYDSMMQKSQNNIDYANAARNIYESDRNYNYQKQQSQLDRDYQDNTFDYTRQQNQQAYDYQKSRDAVNDSHWQTEFNSQAEQNKRAYALNMAQAGDFTLLADVMGVSVDEAKRIYRDELYFESSPTKYFGSGSTTSGKSSASKSSASKSYVSKSSGNTSSASPDITSLFAGNIPNF